MSPMTVAKSLHLPSRPFVLSVLWMLAGCLQVCFGQTKSLETEVVPTENSVRINPHSCGTLIADLVRCTFLVGKHIGV